MEVAGRRRRRGRGRAEDSFVAAGFEGAFGRRAFEGVEAAKGSN